MESRKRVFNMLRWSFMIFFVVLLSRFRRFRDGYLEADADKRNTEMSMIPVPEYDRDYYEDWLYNIVRNY